MSNSGVPLRIIQAVSGHNSIEVLEEYLDVGDEQVRGAIATLSQVSYVKKYLDVDLATTQPNPWHSDAANEPEDSEKYL